MSSGGMKAKSGPILALLSNRITVGLATVLVAAVLVYTIFFVGEGGVRPGTTFVAKRGDLDVTVTAGGSVQALESQEIVSEIEGRDGVKILSIVEEGYRVTAEDVKNGLVLVELDSAQLDDDVVNQEISFQSAEAAYVEKKAQYEIQINQNQSNITTAELTAKFALMDFEKYLGKKAVEAIIRQLELDKIAAELDVLKKAGTSARASALSPLPAQAPVPGFPGFPQTSESPGQREWRGGPPADGQGGQGFGGGERRRREGGRGSGGFNGGQGGGMDPERFKAMIEANGGKLPEAMAERMREMGLDPDDVVRQMQSGQGGGFSGFGGGAAGGMDAEGFRAMIEANGGKIPEAMAERMREMGVDPDQVLQQMTAAPGESLAVEMSSASPSTPATTSAVFVRDDDYSAKRAAIEFATYADADKLEDGQAKQELRQFDDKTLVARQDLGLAQTSLEGKERLAARDFITKNELDLEKVKVKKAEIQLESSEVDRNLYVQYTFVKTAEKLLSDYEEALMNLERTMQEAAAKLSQADAALKTAKQRYNIEMNQLTDLREQLAKCVIVAKRTGLVVYGSSTENNPFRRSNEEPIQEGTTVRERQRIITIPDMTKMGVKVNIHESAVQRLALGQTVRLRIDAFADRPLTGTVDRVAVLADSANMFMNPDLKVYPTTVRIDDVQDWLRPGLSAEVEILIGTLKDVVYVPIQAVSYVGNDQVVYVVSNGQISRRKVTVGQFNEEFIEIRSGLSEGEQVLLLAPNAGKRDAAEDKKKKTEPETDAEAEAA